MIYVLPVTLSHATVKSPSQKDCAFKRSNGYDANGVRVTNIVGFRDGDFLKECPHCHDIYPSKMFGLRYDSVNCRVRDQSYCKRCRSQHTY